MPDRRTQSYAALPSTGSEFVRTPGHVCIPVWTSVDPDPEDPEPELPPSPTFWPRDEKDAPPR